MTRVWIGLAVTLWLGTYALGADEPSQARGQRGGDQPARGRGFQGGRGGNQPVSPAP